VPWGATIRGLARILDGYDYVANFSVNGIELQVLGRSGSIARPLDVSRLLGPATAANQIAPTPPVSNPGTPSNPAKNRRAHAHRRRVIPRALNKKIIECG
jgi:hypothetical protein